MTEAKKEVLRKFKVGELANPVTRESIEYLLSDLDDSDRIRAMLENPVKWHNYYRCELWS